MFNCKMQCGSSIDNEEDVENLDACELSCEGKGFGEEDSDGNPVTQPTDYFSAKPPPIEWFLDFKKRIKKRMMYGGAGGGAD